MCAWIIAKSPSNRILTSSAFSSVNGLGAAIISRNCFLSRSKKSGSEAATGVRGRCAAAAGVGGGGGGAGPRASRGNALGVEGVGRGTAGLGLATTKCERSQARRRQGYTVSRAAINPGTRQLENHG